jgi:hypothetical protein
MNDAYYKALKQRVSKLIVLGSHREKRVIYLTNLITNKLRKIIAEERKGDSHYFNNSTHLDVEISNKQFDLDYEPYGGNSMGVHFIHFSVGSWFSKIYVRVTV